MNQYNLINMTNKVILMSFNFISVFLIAIALAMDAFSVSLTKGFSQKNLKNREIFYYGLFFGGFQCIMPILGYFCVSTISNLIQSFAPVIGFVLLMAIGLNMIRESLTGDEDEITDNFSFKEVTLLAIATSIDAFAVGITFALLNDPIWIPSLIIGAVAFAFSIAGIYIGRILGDWLGDKFQIIGGVILIIIGIKILLGL